MLIGDKLDTRVLLCHKLGERIPCCKEMHDENLGEQVKTSRYKGERTRERRQCIAHKKTKERKNGRSGTTHQNKLCPHGMRAALISPSKHTIQSRLREVLFGLVPPFRLPKDPSDSVGELEVVVDRETVEENAPIVTAPLVANPEVGI